MSAKEMSSSVEAIEAEAEKILKEARSKTNDILLKANDEAGKILSARLAVDEVKKECEQIIEQAREAADKKVKESKNQASKIKTNIEKKADKIIGRIVNSITGADLK
jgi:vacuolar-type H+-ATPase subunit H